jgi:hypothetical protein
MLDFDARYKVYLNVTVSDSSEGAYFQCFPDSGKLKKATFPNELFTRFAFGEVAFSNNPDLYSIASDDAYRTYNLIHDADIDQEIRIKVIVPAGMIDPNDELEFIGYFGRNDCSFDHDEKTLKVNPTILDQYTDLIENMDNEVDVVGETIVRNANWIFNSEYSTENFDESHNITISKLATDIIEAQTPSSPYGTDYTSGFIANCLKEYSAELSLSIAASFVISPGETIQIYINIYNSSDVLLESNLLATYSETGSISTSYTILSTLPKGSYARLYTEISDIGGDYINYTTVSLSLQATGLSFTTTDVSINISEQYLTTREVWTESLHGRASPKESDMIALTEYFEVDGSPKSTLLTDNSLAPSSSRETVSLWLKPSNSASNIDGLFLTDITTVLTTDNGDYELSELTIYKGTTYWAGFIKKRRVYCTCKYTRFEAWMPDAITPPVPSVGWNVHPTITRNSGNETLWTLAPYAGATEWTLGSLNTTGGTIGGIGDWVEKITSSRLGNYPGGDASVIKPSRSLYDIIKTIYTGTHPSLVNKDVKSTFFWNDVDPNITIGTGLNYFTNADNFLNNIACVHTYQFQTPSEDLDDSKLSISIRKMLDNLKMWFNHQIFWFVDSDGDLHIEHISYVDLVRSYKDLTAESGTTSSAALITEIQKWTYDKSKMFSLISFNVDNGGYKDFTNNKITFPKIVSNKRGKDISNTNKIDILTMDVRYCVEFPSDLSNGLVLVNHDDSYNSVSAYVPLANVEWENGNLALSNILNTFAYEGVFSTGTINGTPRDFQVTIRSKKGKTITTKGIQNYDFFKTIIGIGMIESTDYDLNEELTETTLLYRFGSDSQSDVFELMTAIEGDYVGAVSTLYDFGEV